MNSPVLFDALNKNSRFFFQESNLARNRVVRKSSGFAGDKFPVGNAVDGLASTLAHTDRDVLPAWFYVDLGATAYIHHISILNRGEGYGEFHETLLSLPSADGPT